MPSYYAHTAAQPDGTNDPNTERWQLLATHLRNVADLAEKFHSPLPSMGRKIAHRK